MEFDWDTGNTIYIILAFFWGIFCGMMLKKDANREQLESVQLTHIRELYRARKARLCDLLGLPHDIT